MRALRTAAGVEHERPLPTALARAPTHAAAPRTPPPEHLSPSTVVARAEEASAAGGRSSGVLPPVDILEGADAPGGVAGGVGHGGALDVSQRCAWLYLRAQRQFVRSLAVVSEALYTPGASGSSGVRPAAHAARERLASLLAELRPPPLA
jgi:hypothetical protein